MGKILVIAEKPSVARDIAKILNSKTKGDGFLEGEKYIVSWALGHLVTLCDPEDYSESLKKWNFSTLPIIPEEIKLKSVKKTYSQLKVLKTLMNNKNVDSIICATDSGREGELIFRYIYDIVKCKKPFKRLWISSMTDEAIKNGFKNLKDGSEYNNLYISAKCRSEADWLVGINASRAYTIKYKALLSIGRVQTPTLAIITQRQKEIDSFKPEIYYEVTADYESFKGLWFDEKENSTKIFDLKKAEDINAKIKGKEGFVEKIEVEEKQQPPPLLYDLTELQRDCNKKFGFSAQKTLSIAQGLYETKKLITYPRTDSRYLSDDMIGKIKSVLNKLSVVDKYVDFTKYVLNLEKLPLSKRIIDNSKITDHHAIIPTDININVSNLSKDEFNVYNLITLRFLCVFYPKYIYFVTKVITNVLNEKFISKGITITQEGWTNLYKEFEDKKNKNKEVEQKLPDLKEKDILRVIKSSVAKKKTSPPPNYTEATLLSAMENAGRFVENEDIKEQMKESGLGTPATRAAIIERLISVGYIERKAKSIVPTEKGKKLIMVIPFQLASPETTGKWEKGLSSIAKGNMSQEKFMTSIKKYVSFLVDDAYKSENTVVFEDEQRYKATKNKSLGKCPLCQNGSILENTKGFYCSHWKEGCKFTIWKNSLENNGIKIDASIIRKLLKNKRVEKIDIFKAPTKEKCTATLILKADMSGALELMNVTKKEQ